MWRIACALVAFLTVVSVPVRWQCEGVDEIEYLSLARSLSAGLGYTIDGEPHVLYPPLFPVVLAAVSKAAGVGSWQMLYSVNAALGCAGLILLGHWLRRRHGRAGRWGAWFALVAYFPWSFSTRYLLSEPLFLFLSALALIAADRLRAGVRRQAVWLVLFVLLCVMTRVGSVALAASVAASLAIAAIRARRRVLWVAALSVALASAAFLGFWEWRAAKARPDAAESYGKWARALVGMPADDDSFVGKHHGEGVEGPTTPAQRAVIAAVKLGQYTASIVRLPGPFVPLAAFIALTILIGMAVELRRQPDSPFAWYAIATLAMVCATSWVSSYHRYFYPLTPLWWFFLFRGAGFWISAGSRAGTVVRGFALSAAGVACAAWALRVSVWPEGPGSEALYLRAVSAASVTAYALFAAAGVVIARGLRGRWNAVALLPVLLLGWTLHDGYLMAKRFQRVRANESLEARRLAGPLDVAEWLRWNTPRDARIVASVPRLVSLAADRDARAGGPELSPGDIAVLLGTDIAVPAFNAEREAALRGQVETMLNEGRAKLLFGSGEAGAFEISGPTRN